MPSSPQQTLPWTKSPLIVNAPMGGIAYSSLALAVHSAGGFGLIGAALDLTVVDKELSTASQALSKTDSGHLPVGVGFLLFALKLEDVVPIVRKYKPAVVWLSMPKKFEDFATWTLRVREVSPGTQVWIQIGSVASALEVVEACRPDALAVQGSDAGGHGFEKGAGIISLLPEVNDALEAAGLSPPLLAAGGTVDGRGVTASLALGAQGVVMGTRFLSCPETNIHARYRDAVLAASDGGQSTIRSKLFDNLPGANVWPEYIDGRGIVAESYTDHENDVGIEEIRRMHKDALSGADAGYGVDGEGRAAMWAGTGVGIVRRQQGAAEVVEEVRREAKRAAERAKANL